MKQLIRTFLASILLVFLLFACGEEEVKPVVDYRCKVTSTSTLEKIYANNPVPIQLKIEKNNSEVGNYNFSYTVIEGSGDLIIDGHTLAEGEILPIKLESFTPSFVPTSLGKHRLKFKFANEEYITESMYFITASELVFEAHPENLPKKLLIDKPFAFDLNLSQKIEEGTISEFNAKIQILKGKGFVSFFGANDTVPTLVTRSEDSLQKAASPQYKVRIGNNKLHYKSTEPGENILLLQVENEFGYEQDLNVPLNIELPDFKVVTTADSIMSVGTINNFLLNIVDTDNFGANIYNVSYRNIKNSGKLKINGNEILVGATLQLQKGDNVCEFVPAALGEASLEFIVKDKYNSTRKDTTKFLSERSFVNVEVSNYDSLATIFDSRDISFSVDKTNYTGKYYIDIAQVPNGVASIKINGVDYAGGKMLIANTHNTLVTFVPKTIGDIKLNLKVYDDFGSETVKSLAFKVSNSEGKIAVSNHNPAVNIFNPTSFNFGINKPKYTGKFQFEILQLSPEQVIPKSFGTLKVNNLLYPGGRIDVTNSNNTTVTFTAEQTGEMILRLNVYDDFGGVISEDLTYNINNTDIKLTPQNLDKELLLMKDEVFTITPSKPFYGDKKLTLSITTIPANAGTLKVNGQSYVAGGMEVVANNVAIPISYTPAKEGASELLIKAFDEWGAQVKYPITFNVTNPPIQIQHFDFVSESVINTEKVFSFSVLKNNYSEGFKYSIITKPADAGTFLVDDAAYPGGLTTLVNPKSTKLGFIPTIAEDIKMTLTVTDLYGGTVSRDYVYKVSNPKLNLSLTNVEDDLKLNTRSTFTFGVQKQSYTGKYYFEITGENCEDVKINNINYTLGERKEVNNALGTSVSFVPTKVGRDTIKLALSVYDDWGGVVNQKLTFSVTNSDIDLQIKNRESALFVGRPSSFTISATKPNYAGNLKYEIRLTPADMGTLKVADKDYISGQGEIKTGQELPVVFTPKKEGSASLKVIITDDWSGEKSESFGYTITTTPIQMEFEGYRSEATLNAASVFTMSLSKLYYTGGYNYSITTEPASVGTIKVNDVEYTGGKFPIIDPENTKIAYTPSEAGEVALSVNVTDNIGGKQTKTLAFKVADNPIDLVVNNQTVGLTLHAETGFNFAVAKKGYKGKFQFEIVTDPASVGTFKVNGTAYTGGRMDVSNTTNTLVNFTPSVVGDLKMSVKVYDEFGGERTQELPFSVKNSDLKIVVSNQKSDIIYNTATVFNFGVLKPNYSGTYQYEITQSPASAGTIKVNGTAYTTGKAILTAPALSTVEFVSTTPGQNILTLKVYDEIEGTTQENIIFTCTNPELKVTVTNHNPNIAVNTETTFNFNVSKESYTGSFKFQIGQEPAESGILLLNSKEYDGTQVILDKTSNVLSFTPTRVGNIKLNITVTDDWGTVSIVPVVFSVLNTEIAVNVTNKEQNIVLNKPTTLNFAVSKPKYTGSFKAKVVMSPSDAGSVKLNSNVIGSSDVNIAANNTLEFTPSKKGAALLKLVVSDEFEGTKETALNFNVLNPEIILAVTNHNGTPVFKKATSFNVAMTKQGYSGAYQYEITQEPAEGGTLTIDGKPYTGGIATVANPNNLSVGFTPTKEGYLSLRVRVIDETKQETSKFVAFNVTNPPVQLSINAPSDKNVSVGKPVSFTVRAEKTGYTGNFTYEITPMPVDCGDVTVGGKTNLVGILNPNPGTVTFTPSKLGTTIFNVKVSDADGKFTEKQVDFNVNNTPLDIALVNSETSIVLKSPHSFVFKTTKENYPDAANVTYTIAPAYTGTLIVDGKAYTGTSISIPYGRLKNGINIQYTPDREGTRELSFSAKDDFNGFATKTIAFDVTNPELSLYLTGINTGAANDATLGSTYKFYYNVSKANYNDDFSYWLTLDPSAVGIVGTSDVTPRGRSSIQMETGTITNNPNGVATGEIRFTPTNADFLNKDVKVKIVIRDKWNNEKTAEAQFHIVTSAIAINVTRNTSIPVEEPYNFFFTVAKPGYNAGFKYSIVGWADGDKLELSADNTNWVTYSGGKFDLPHVDHTYVRYTPKNIGTVPLKLFIYDNINGEAMQELTFDVKPPVVTLSADATIKQGYTEEFVPFSLKATDGKKENMSVAFSIEDAAFSGELKFNNTPVVGGSSRARSAGINVASGTTNKLEISSRKIGSWGVTTTATNRFKESASVTTSIQVDKKPNYTLITSTTGQGKVDRSMKQPADGYESGTSVTLTATPSEGWKFVRWQGDASGTSTSTSIVMDRNKNVVAVFASAEGENILPSPVSSYKDVEFVWSYRDQLDYGKVSHSYDFTTSGECYVNFTPIMKTQILNSSSNFELSQGDEYDLKYTFFKDGVKFTPEYGFNRYRLPKGNITVTLNLTYTWKTHGGTPNDDEAYDVGTVRLTVGLNRIKVYSKIQ